MRLRFWLTNRVVWGLVALFVLVGLWEFRWKPQYRPFYQQGVLLYQSGDYAAAAAQLERAYAVAPNAVDVLLMLGWTNLKLRRMDEAEFYFRRATAIEPRTHEAQMGAAFVALETGRGSLDTALVQRIIAARGADPNLRLLLAGALQREARYFEAAAVFEELQSDRDYGHSARAALEEIFGLRGFASEAVPRRLPPRPRPRELQVGFRAAEGALWRRHNGDWQRFYVAGVNLGPAAPGYYPGAPPNDGALYTAWLRQADQMNANTLRVYTLLPPAFYRAFHHYKRAGGRMVLYQQVWIGDPPEKDLYEAGFVEQSRAEIRHVVDAIHGQGLVPHKTARGSGVFDQDVAAHVGALLLGREVEASVALITNQRHPEKQDYAGRFLSVRGGNATEVWFAEMLDYLVAYQEDTYHWQHPVAIVNWPPLDPLHHPTEAPIADEVRFRIARGEPLAMPTGIEDDNDVVAIDEAKYTATADFQAGLFASYHVYPYWPDFLLHEPRYLRVRDADGPNPMLGYLRELRARLPHPLVITEFGIPDSMGNSHFHPFGFHHGGHTEAGQAALLGRMARTIREAGCAGGVVFAHVDEWYKHNWLTAPFQVPIERAALWLNHLDPEQRYGMVGYRTRKWKLFAGDAAAWQQEATLYQAAPAGPSADPWAGARHIEQVQAAADEGFLYLRLKVGCLDCGARQGRAGEPRFTRAAYAIALSTTPGISGLQQMPFTPMTLATGANFLLVLGAPEVTRLLVAESYNPYQTVPRAGAPGETDLVQRRGFTPALAGRGRFEEQVVETNRRRFARDGRTFPGRRTSRSLLHKRAGDEAEAGADSLAEWYADPARDEIVVRLAWGKLLITDPSSRQAFYGFDDGMKARTIPSAGVEVTVFALEPGRDPADLTQMRVAGVLPAAAGGRIEHPARFAWPRWDEVRAEMYFKRAYYEMQKKFGAYAPAAPDAGAAVRAGSPGR